jgi:uncharacterized protein (TIGR02246 family)
MKRLLAGIALLALVLGSVTPLWSASDEEKIEAVVEAVVNAYQTGDYEAMGRYYASDVTVVPADFAPPLRGWETVKQRYQLAAANMTGMAMTRENTLIKRRGKVAWVVYQWRFAGVAGGQAVGALGHTTLILEKRSGKWLIVHNHTSALPTVPAAEKSSATTQP